MRVVVTGGSGFIGNFLTGVLVAKGHFVTDVTRNPERVRTARANVEVTGWLPDLSKFDAVVHLAGEPIFGGRWNEAKKQAIRESRIRSTERIVQGLAEAEPRPPVFVCASAIGIYGDRGDEELSEESPPGDDFLASVCRDWEAAAVAAEPLGVRTIRLRTGIVLGTTGGALHHMLTPFRFGLGGPIGSGRQWMSWVHIRDLCQLILHAIESEDLHGPLHGTAPHPVRNREFARTLGRILRRPAILPTPRFLLKLVLGEAADVLTASQRCLATKAENSGFQFDFPELERALRHLLHR